MTVNCEVIYGIALFALLRLLYSDSTTLVVLL